MKTIATTTGHFAQPLTPSHQNRRRFVQQRKRSAWGEFLQAVSSLEAVGTSQWRARNRVFNEDTCILLPLLKEQEERPAVVYADPPYTEDQYSRYYHILETLVHYDYPATASKGEYRDKRFQSPFSIKSKSPPAFELLVSSTSAMGADLVLSYPESGILHAHGIEPLECLRRHFSRAEICCVLKHEHSTFGASKGSARAQVNEIVYWARP